ncbi:MAG: histidine kinase dimerization/phospho-acceptor domain-containing protein, partial [Myxococcota bacterium]
MKQARAIQGALIGFSGGLAIMVVTLALEVYAHEYQLQGGLLKLQRESVAVWVLESIPILLAGAAFVVMSPQDTWRADVNRRARDRKETEATSPPAQTLPPSPPSAPPVPASVSASNSAPLSGPPSTPSFTAPTGSSTGGPPSGGLAVASSPPPPPVPGKLRKANILGNAGSGQRVKALQELVKTLKEHAAQATDQSRAKSAMLTNLTQELRSPLNQIVGVTEMLVEEAQDPRQSAASLQADLRRVAGAGRHLVRLINEILDLSRIEVGQLALVLEDVDLAQILEEVRASLGSASSTTIAFHLDAA